MIFSNDPNLAKLNAESVNTSIGRYGKHEQWVYGGGQYLYFENGVVTSIQPSR
jgi:hypothetical protein